MFQIKDIARMNGISTRSIRLFEEYGVISPKREENGYRQYTMEDSLQIADFLSLRSLGFDVDEAVFLCKNQLSKETLSMVSRKAADIEEQLSDMQLRLRKITIFRDIVEFALNNQDVVIYKREQHKLFFPVISGEEAKTVPAFESDAREWIKMLPITQHMMFYSLEQVSADGNFYPELGLSIEATDLETAKLPINDSCIEIPECCCLQVFHSSPSKVSALDPDVYSVFHSYVADHGLRAGTCIMAFPLFAGSENNAGKTIYKYLMMLP